MNNKLTKLFIFFSTFILSCQEGSIKESGNFSSRDYILAENTFNDISEIVRIAFFENGEYKGCPEYINQNLDTTNTDTLIIDFGDGIPDECIYYGKEIKGKIIVIYNGKYLNYLTQMTISFDELHINNNRVQGLMKTKNNGENEDGNTTFTIEIIEASINGDGKIDFESYIEKTWVAGRNTITNLIDDIYLINGYSSGNSRNGENFSANIIEDLYMEIECKTQNQCIITSGVVEIIPEGYSNRTINYGDSTCDCNYSITLNGDNQPIVVN
tara:strand:+ start:17883 stop:18692 length:810 start_codon:yes stop_codon:yes gene_type:complete